MRRRARGALVVFAKAPRSGGVKTRLCPPLSPDEAAELYAAMLADVLAVSAEAARSLELDCVLAVHPAQACAELARDAPKQVPVVAQRGADLGARMAWAAREQAAAGHGRVLLRGSDSPLLGPEVLADTLAGLARAELSLSPDPDGGYNAVGLRHPVPGIFDHPMSSAGVFRETESRARARGLRVYRALPSWDVDRGADLARLCAAPRTLQARLCPRTLGALEALESCDPGRLRGARESGGRP